MTTYNKLHVLTTIFTIISSIVTTSHASTNIGQPIQEYFDYHGPLLGEQSCSLISVVMDESGSMATAQEFMRRDAIPSIVQRLSTEGIDNVFVCIHGFGSSEHDLFGMDRGHFHGCTEGTTLGILDSSPMDSWVTKGKNEDGWQAIHTAISDLPSEINGKNLSQTCKSMGRNMILVTDEARHNNSCDGHLFQMEFQTDENGAETFWELQDSQSEIVSQDGGHYLPHQIVRVTQCLEKNDHYKLLFSDTNSDGFCCNHGNGYIKVWLDGELVADSPANFQSYACVMMPAKQHASRQKLQSTNYFSLENTQQKLLDTGYRLTTITILSLYGLNLDTPITLGVMPDASILEPDGNGSYTGNHEFTSDQRPLTLLDPNQMALQYASIAFETGGGAWLLHALREGGQTAESFKQAFVDFNARDFLEDAFRTHAPSIAPSMNPSSTPSTQPSVVASLRPSTATFQPSEKPTSQPSASTTQTQTEEGVFDGRIETHNDDSETREFSRIIVGFATFGLLFALGVAFAASRKRKEDDKEEEEDEKDDHSISISRPRAGDTETESLDDTEEPSFSSPLDILIGSDDDDEDEDDRFSLTGLAKCMEFSSSSFRWDQDQDHMVDLSELAGEYGGGFQRQYDGRAFEYYDEGEYDD